MEKPVKRLYSDLLWAAQGGQSVQVSALANAIRCFLRGVDSDIPDQPRLMALLIRTFSPKGRLRRAERNADLRDHVEREQRKHGYLRPACRSVHSNGKINSDKIGEFRVEKIVRGKYSGNGLVEFLRAAEAGKPIALQARRAANHVLERIHRLLLSKTGKAREVRGYANAKFAIKAFGEIGSSEIRQEVAADLEAPIGSCISPEAAYRTIAERFKKNGWSLDQEVRDGELVEIALTTGNAKKISQRHKKTLSDAAGAVGCSVEELAEALERRDLTGFRGKCDLTGS